MNYSVQNLTQVADCNVYLIGQLKSKPILISENFLMSE